jgi:uncharacterized protein YrrD
MLRSVKDLEKCTIGASDGVIGKVEDFYFDDEAWAVRYLVVDTGAWLSNRHVLISPHAIRNWGWEGAVLPVSISREQVKNSPDVDTHKPVSRQYERSYFGYYGYPYYWNGAGLWGEDAYPGIMTAAAAAAAGADSAAVARARENDDPHLRSCNSVAGYDLHAADGAIGHIESFLIDEGSWAIRFLIVNTSNWWLGHQVLIAPEWIDSVSWLHATVTTDLTRQAVKDSPLYDPGALPDGAAEARIYKHYGRSAYGTGVLKRRVA